MKNRTIAVGIDFSEFSDAALEQATWLAKRRDAQLLLIDVGIPALPATSSLLPSLRVWEKIVEERNVTENQQTKELAKNAADSTIDLVHSWQLPPPVGPAEASPALASVSLDIEKLAKEEGKMLVEKHTTGRIHLNFEALKGPTASTLLAHAKEDQARYDLVVLGSHGRRGFRRFFLGSVAEKVVRHAPCSALVVHRDTPLEQQKEER